uniref:Uncharacterized protein n=1 Tax=Echinococcus canadensis TaxID=519352 RepID=A0A915EYT7_9CEST
MSKQIVSKKEANFERQARSVFRGLGEPQKIIVLFRIDTAFQTSAKGGKVKPAIQTIGYNKNWPSDPLKDTSIQPYLSGIRQNFILSKNVALFEGDMKKCKNELGIDDNSKQHPVTPESYGLIS